MGMGSTAGSQGRGGAAVAEPAGEPIPGSTATLAHSWSFAIESCACYRRDRDRHQSNNGSDYIEPHG
jgi:hypothetical protein